MANKISAENAKLEGLWARHFEDPRRERALLSALSFNVAFASCRFITHAIKNEWGPFHDMSAGGRHLHHSTFGIFGLIGIGYVWTYRWALGDVRTHPRARWASRGTATLYGVFSALTLDEFALWFDLEDDYWNAAGRKSIDSVALFSSLLSAGVAGRPALREAALAMRKARD